MPRTKSSIIQFKTVSITTRSNSSKDTLSANVFTERTIVVLHESFLSINILSPIYKLKKQSKQIVLVAIFTYSIDIYFFAFIIAVVIMGQCLIIFSFTIPICLLVFEKDIPSDAKIEYLSFANSGHLDTTSLDRSDK